MRQASGSVERQHQGVVKAQRNKVYETTQSASGVPSGFWLTLSQDGTVK